MNNVQIEKALRSDDTVTNVFIGVFSADTLPSPKEFPAAYIANTEPSDMSGQHWVAFYCVNDTIECFDSFGRNPAEYSEHLAAWINDDYKIVQIETLQSDDSTVCGQYCMFFVLLRAYGFSYEDVMSALTSDTVVNDRFVCKFINRFFKMRTVVRDKQFFMTKMLKQ